MKPDENLNKSKPVVAIGLSRIVSLLLVLIRIIFRIMLILFMYYSSCVPGAPPWSSGSVLDHRSLPPVFESRRGHIWRLFCLSLRLITFGGRSAHLAYLVQKIGSKTSIIIIIFIMCTDILIIYFGLFLFMNFLALNLVLFQ